MDYFDHRYLALVGHVQSGKTNEEISYCYNSIEHHNTPVVFLTRNIIADQLQLRDRFQSFNIDTTLLSHSTLDEGVRVLQSTGIIILLCNQYQLHRMKQILLKYNGKYNMCIDEVDFSIKNKNSKIDILLSELKQNASHILGATATPVAVLSHDKPSIIKKMNPGSHYYGIDTLNINFVDPCIIQKELPLCDSECMGDIYDSLLEKDHAFLLHTVVKKKEVHKKLQNYLSDLYKSFTVITYNGDGIRVICNSRKSTKPLADKKSLNNYNQLINKYFILQEYSDSPLIHLFKNYSISEVLQILVDDPEHNHTHISIISGNLASRGISFVSTDYTLHLTDQYLYINKTTHGENLLQSLRILGCYKDNKPLTLWCSKKTWESILEQNTIVNNLVNGLDNSKEWMYKLKTIYINKPKNPLTRPKLKINLNKNENNYYIDLNEED